MGPAWVLSDPDAPRVGPMNLAIRAFTLGWQQNWCLQSPELSRSVIRHGVLHTNLPFVISLKCGFSPGLKSSIILFREATENQKISSYHLGLFSANRRKITLYKSMHIWSGRICLEWLWFSLFHYFHIYQICHMNKSATHNTTKQGKALHQCVQILWLARSCIC